MVGIAMIPKYLINRMKYGIITMYKTKDTQAFLVK
jgi:hypothetical protein